MGKQNIKMALKNRKVPGMVKYCSKIGYSLSPITRNPQVAERVKPLWEKRDHSNYKIGANIRRSDRILTG